MTKTEDGKTWGDRDLFLTQHEKRHLGNWVNRNEVFTITYAIFEPIYRRLQALVPTTIAPNVLTLSALLCVVNGVYLCVRYIDRFPLAVSLASTLLAIGYQVLMGIDGVHAKATANDSNLGHVFSRFCTYIGVVMQTMILCAVLEIDDVTMQWYIVQVVVLGLLTLNARAFNSGVLRYPLFFGEEELMTLFELVLLARACGLLDVLYGYYAGFVVPLVAGWLDSVPFLPLSLSDPTQYNGKMYIGPSLLTLWLIRLAFVISSVMCLGVIIRGRSDRKATRHSLLAIYALRMLVPAALMHFGLYEIDIIDVICDGLFVSMVTADLLVSKMCKKDLHPWLVLFALASLMSHALMFAVYALYFFVVLFEIASYLNLPMLTMNVNVYIDGVYDMCHFGHFEHFKRSAKQGTRLFVGVLTDEDVATYKRSPVMKHEERVRQVKTSRHVYQVVEDAPLSVTDELIEKYRIHKVLCSEEYDSPDDYFYTVPRKRGILVVMPRVPGISTSDLIRRIKARVSEEERALSVGSITDSDATIDSMMDSMMSEDDDDDDSSVVVVGEEEEGDD